MPDFDRDTGQLALLEAYERTLTSAPDAPPPADLDPALAATARALARHLGAPPAGRAAAPTAAFRAALRERLADQAASYPAIPARTAPPSVAAAPPSLNGAGRERRRASFGPRGTTPAAPQRTDAAEDAPASPAQSVVTGDAATPHRRPLRVAVANGVGWLGAALVILIVILAATLLLRGLPRTTPATQPTLPPPSAVPAPSTTAAPLSTATVAQPTAPVALTATLRPTAPLWQPTGALNLPRAQHSATRLADGRVLVAGGYGNSGGGEASAEIFDPQTGAWSGTGAMGTARIQHSALLLPDGQVLVAGGFNNSVNNNTTSITGAERYDPSTGQWQPTATPPVGLGLVRMALLADGRALLIASSPAGRPSEERPLTALIYDTSADRWSELGTLDFTIVPLAVPLADGRTLLLGEAGQINDGTTPALLLDPATGATTPAPLPEPRIAYSANRLLDGSIVVMGGRGWSDVGRATTNTTFRFDPTTNRWSPSANLGTPRENHTSVLLADGRVLAIGGNTNATIAAVTAEIYDPRTDRWARAGILESGTRAGFAVAPLADGRALLIGGDAGFVRSEYLASVELFTPPSGAGATTRPGPGTATPGPSSGIADWDSPSAGLLFHNGRGYRLGGPTLPDGSAPQVGAQVGSTLLRWQSGGVFPAGAPIYAVQGLPAEEWLIMRDGVRVILYRHDDDTTALLAGIQVVEGRVAGDGATVCPGYGCPATPTMAQQGTVATANRVRVERALQGSIAAGTEIEVRQMGVPVAEGETARIATLRPGERVLLFLQPAQGQSIGDFSSGDYYWTGLGWAYGFVGDTIVPLGSGGVQTPLDRFEAAIREIFAAVTPRAPTDPVPTPRPVPTATGIAPQPTAPLPASTATPTPTPTL